MKVATLYPETRLEKILRAHPEYQFVRGLNGSPQEIQAVLDRITLEIVESGTSEMLSEHALMVYEQHSDAIETLPDRDQIIPEFLDFIQLVKDGNLVLDLGCGSLARDTLFACISASGYRQNRMKRKVRGLPLHITHVVPTKRLQVHALDGSEKIFNRARDYAEETLREHVSTGDYFPIFEQGDMHNLQMYKDASFDAVWSSTALLTFTPKTWLESSLVSVARVLKKGGLFAVSYMPREDGMGYHEFRFDETLGRVRYYSHPSVELVSILAQQSGLMLIPRFSTLTQEPGQRFAVQFFRKI